MTSQLEETSKPRTREAQSTNDSASGDVISLAESRKHIDG
jgi:hypothetical protein